jgi:hypothetical protein
MQPHSKETLETSRLNNYNIKIEHLQHATSKSRNQLHLQNICDMEIKLLQHQDKIVATSRKPWNITTPL